MFESWKTTCTVVANGMTGTVQLLCNEDHPISYHRDFVEYEERGRRRQAGSRRRRRGGEGEGGRTVRAKFKDPPKCKSISCTQCDTTYATATLRIDAIVEPDYRMYKDEESIIVHHPYWRAQQEDDEEDEEDDLMAAV